MPGLLVYQLPLPQGKRPCSCCPGARAPLSDSRPGLAGCRGWPLWSEGSAPSLPPSPTSVCFLAPSANLLAKFPGALEELRQPLEAITCNLQEHLTQVFQQDVQVPGRPSSLPCCPSHGQGVLGLGSEVRVSMAVGQRGVLYQVRPDGPHFSPPF